ncbi:MAG: hypothetical protein U1E10_14780, partial [Bdellovibrionales bacterium]|nr:hypothetical protein [Bdellovibrionales bacterium]
FSFLMLFSACASAPDSTTDSQSDAEMFPELRERRVYRSGETAPVIVDYDGLQKSLGMTRPLSDYGYVEKEFATCEAGYGYSSTHQCRKNVFVVVGFQLLCRDSEGTVSTTLRYDDMQPLASRTISWELKGDRGQLVLDSQGRGQFRGIYAVSPRDQRLKITSRNDFLYMQAQAIKRIITPSNWCR